MLIQYLAAFSIDASLCAPILPGEEIRDFRRRDINGIPKIFSFRHNGALNMPADDRCTMVTCSVPLPFSVSEDKSTDPPCLLTRQLYLMEVKSPGSMGQASPYSLNDLREIYWKAVFV